MPSLERVDVRMVGAQGRPLTAPPPAALPCGDALRPRPRPVCPLLRRGARAPARCLDARRWPMRGRLRGRDGVRGRSVRGGRRGPGGRWRARRGGGGQREPGGRGRGSAGASGRRDGQRSGGHGRGRRGAHRRRADGRAALGVPVDHARELLRRRVSRPLARVRCVPRRALRGRQLRSQLRRLRRRPCQRLRGGHASDDGPLRGVRGGVCGGADVYRLRMRQLPAPLSLLRWYLRVAG